MIFGRLSFPGEGWYVVTVLVPRMVRDEKKFGNHCSNSTILYTMTKQILYTNKLSSDKNCISHMANSIQRKTRFTFLLPANMLKY